LGTRFEWNIDSLLRRKLKPNDSATVLVYERDLDQAASPRKKGDLRVLRQMACCADLRRRPAQSIGHTVRVRSPLRLARVRIARFTKKSPPILNIPT